MLKKYFPIFNWLLDYQKVNLRGDLAVGLTVAVMLVPQAMAYAMLTGLPPVVGLYASTIPIIAYVLLGIESYAINSVLFFIKNLLVLIPTVIIIGQIVYHKDDEYVKGEEIKDILVKRAKKEFKKKWIMF